MTAETETEIEIAGGQGIVAPYPADGWPKLSATEAQVHSLMASWWSQSSVEQGVAALQGLLGVPIEVRARKGSLTSFDRGALCPMGPTILLERNGDSTQRMGIELEAALTWALIDRALGGEGEVARTTPSPLLDEVSRGILLYVAARALDGTAWVAVDICTTSEALVAFLRHTPSNGWPFELRFGESLFAFKGWLPRRIPSARALLASENYARFPDITHIELRFALTVARARLTRKELRGLRVGDVVIVDEASWRRGARSFRAQLKARGAKRWRSWCTAVSDALEEVRQLTLEEFHLDPAPSPTIGSAIFGRAHARNAMATNESSDTLLDAFGDAPIDLSVEIAELRMPLEEVAALRVGSVIRTGKAIDDRVSLCVGERAIAEGELVDIDGEVGVRVLRLSSSATK